MPRGRRRLLVGFAVLAALGATLGSALDAIHTYGGATAYTNPVFARAAWWVPLLFGGAYAGGLARPLVDRGARPAAWQAALGMGLFALAYALSVAPWSWPARAAVIGGIFVASFLVCDRKPVGLAIAAGAAFAGPAVEIALLRAGTFVHHEGVVLGVPGWLPFLYMTASVGLGTLATWLVRPSRSPSLTR